VLIDDERIAIWQYVRRHGTGWRCVEHESATGRPSSQTDDLVRHFHLSHYHCRRADNRLSMGEAVRPLPVRTAIYHDGVLSSTDRNVRRAGAFPLHRDDPGDGYSCRREGSEHHQAGLVVADVAD
jgi:hypothetical protein